MRGKILQYNGSDGRGTIAAEGQQYSFGIGAWKGEAAPAVGKTVEVAVGDGQIMSVKLVGDDVLLKEKSAELGAKLGSLVSSGAGGNIVALYGRNLLIAFGVYLLGTLFFNAISINFLGTRQGQSLWNLARMMEAFGGGGGIKLVLFLSYVGLAVPLVWKERRGWLALLLPLVTVAYAIFQGSKLMGGLGGGGDDGPGLFSILGLGMYLSLAAAVYIALAGYRRFKAG